MQVGTQLNTLMHKNRCKSVCWVQWLASDTEEEFLPGDLNYRQTRQLKIKTLYIFLLKPCKGPLETLKKVGGLAQFEPEDPVLFLSHQLRVLHDTRKQNPGCFHWICGELRVGNLIHHNVLFFCFTLWAQWTTVRHPHEASARVVLQLLPLLY